MRVSPVDTMKRKQFIKGTEQIAQEGAIQIFKIPYSGMEEVIVGVVGTLQFDVFQYRIYCVILSQLYVFILSWIPPVQDQGCASEDSQRAIRPRRLSGCVVGTLQFDVFQYRMRSEYGVELRMAGLAAAAAGSDGVFWRTACGRPRSPAGTCRNRPA